MRVPHSGLVLSVALCGLSWGPPGLAQPYAQPLPPDMAAPPEAAMPAAPVPPPALHDYWHQRLASPAGAGDPGAADDTGGHWAHEPGTGLSGPASNHASNLGGADTGSAIAPHLQSPNLGPDAGPEGYLLAASAALRQNRTGEAQQALEMAETRLLDRSTPVSAAGQPDQDPRVQAVDQALQALGRNDAAAAQNAIQQAIRSGG